MKRALKIIITIVVIALIVLLVLWLVARHKAIQNGKTPPQFKDFFTFNAGIPNANPIGPSGEETSPFTSSTTTSLPTGPQEGTSLFTNGTLGLGDGSLGLGSFASPSNQGFPGGNNQTTTNNQTSTPPPSNTSSGIPVEECSDADSNIVFTTDELNQLSDLSQQFYTLAQTLHSDADVVSAQSAYESFKVQDDQLVELNNYCRAQAPLISDPAFKVRVPTPFWYEPNSAGYTFFGTKDQTNINDAHDHTSVTTYYSLTDLVKNSNPVVNTYRASVLLERMLRISLW